MGGINKGDPAKLEGKRRKMSLKDRGSYWSKKTYFFSNYKSKVTLSSFSY